MHIEHVFRKPASQWRHSEIEATYCDELATIWDEACRHMLQPVVDFFAAQKRKNFVLVPYHKSRDEKHFSARFSGRENSYLADTCYAIMEKRNPTFEKIRSWIFNRRKPTRVCAVFQMQAVLGEAAKVFITAPRMGLPERVLYKIETIDYDPVDKIKARGKIIHALLHANRWHLSL